MSDVHANAVALDAVLADMPPVDRIVNAGDVVGYNPWPGACVETVRERTAVSVIGNHDLKVATETNFSQNRMAQAGIRHAIEELSAEQREWIASLSDSRRCCADRVKVVHGHPDHPNHYTYPEEFGPHLLDDEDVLVMGHTHVQHAEQYDEGIVLNPGSVGQPRDRDPRAAYAIVDLDALSVETRRVEYDVDAVVDAIEAAGLPERTGARLRRGE
ncbi:phosphodiesterase, MJ0936 family [Halanaeroarchaeum sulfurireducens]|uniref:Phosphodiesterase, MJ0936 family n=1 Tax=Halanaeroarchaeum sulfurireducens TaxID=1604004 RepID=A0A0F7PA79_9EURY|nr:phosphodiesterase, MJ0936 family [Halanaeroarchaeum sulfurireducens]ALG80926.1 phosphodiesterase, MJ0936 family [Halanaeroarchaeum sulfurireducens]